MLKTENNEEKNDLDLTLEECELYNFFINEYNDIFENVLNLKGKNLYSIIKNNVILLMGKSNFNKYSKNSLKKVYNKIKEDYFEPDNIVIKYLKDNLDSISVRDLPILNIDSIFAHCNKCYESIHICGEPLYNYKYYDLIICIKCKMIYKKNMIRLFCNSCKEEYYSYIVNESNYKNDFFPATWEKYHCFSFNYDQMECPECSSPLYYSAIKKKLKCFKCNWISPPDKVEWECEICGEKFTSKVKEFVKYETKPEIDCIKYALINRINAKPFKCKCCKENPININFFHPGCGGGYFLSSLQKKYVVVCNKCKMIQNPDNMKWGCGNCKKNFICDKMIVLESILENEKKLKMDINSGPNSPECNKNKKINLKNQEKCLTNQKKSIKTKKNGNNEIKSQKILLKPKNKIINERNRDCLKLNLEKCLKTIDVGENDCKTKFEKINKNFDRYNGQNSSNTSIEFYVLKKNDSENKLCVKEENMNKTLMNNDISIGKIEKMNSTKNLIDHKKVLDKKNETENNIDIRKSLKEKKNKRRKIKKEKSKILTEDSEKFKKLNSSKIIKIDNHASSTMEQIKEYPEMNQMQKYDSSNNFASTKRKSNKNIQAKYNRIKQKQNIEKSDIKGQSQKKSKNIRLNFSLNININNILENNNLEASNKFNNNTIHSIKPDKYLKISTKEEPEENFNPDEFKIIEKIGFGSFGKIYKVRWMQNNKNYAMKIINLKFFEDIEDTQKKIKLMGDFCRKTNAPGIIKIYGNVYEKAGNNDYKFYILMELAQTDWEQEINFRNKKNLFYTQTELFDIIKQLVFCYSSLQKNNISHRDVKPQNILVLNGLYKICDFGEARTISGKNGYIHQPIRGSELYMSPILFDALNNNQTDVLHNSYKSDVFSLGMCFFLAATLSFDSLYEIREEKNMKKIKNILEKFLLEHYSKNLVDILYNMLQVDEDLRPNFIELEKLILINKLI